MEKVNFCKTIFDFKSNDRAKADEGRDTKRQCLLDLIKIFESTKRESKREIDENLGLLFEMIQVNIFRTPKAQVTSLGSDIVEVMNSKNEEIEDTQVMLELAWPHL